MTAAMCCETCATIEPTGFAVANVGIEIRMFPVSGRPTPSWRYWGVAQVVRRRDDDYERQRQRRESELALEAADVPTEELVGDETGEDGQQERVDQAVADAARAARRRNRHRAAVPSHPRC